MSPSTRARTARSSESDALWPARSFSRVATTSRKTSRSSWWGFAARSPEKTAVYSYERKTAAFTREQQARLEADEAAWAFFRAQAPSWRRSITYWVSSAKRDETRERRLVRLLEDSRAGRRTGALG